MKTSQDQNLLERILAGDEEALKMAYLDFRPNCIAYLRKQFTSYTYEAAAELYNDAFVEMWRNILAGKIESLSSFVSYLIGVAKNLAHDQLRSIERQSRFLEKIAYDLPSDDQPPTEMEGEQERQRVQSLLNRLGDRCRQLLVMHYFLHFDDHVVADNLEIPYDRVRKERHKCLAKARGEIQNVESL